MNFYFMLFYLSIIPIILFIIILIIMGITYKFLLESKICLKIFTALSIFFEDHFLIVGIISSLYYIILFSLILLN